MLSLLVGESLHCAICPLPKELCLNGCLGVGPRKVQITLADGLYDLEGGGFIFADGLNGPGT
jgi:hypothetical protein